MTSTPREVLKFIEQNGIVLESARGPVPNVAREIAGEEIRGSWWAHPKGRAIFQATQLAGQSDDVLVCKLIARKVTYVHRRLWPALVKLSSRFRASQLARTWNEHSESGAHESKTIPYPKWVPPDVIQEAKRLSTVQAEKMLTVLWRQ